jgi:uncharacterized protein (DUF983 family)
MFYSSCALFILISVLIVGFLYLHSVILLSLSIEKSHFRALIIFVTLSLVIRMAVLSVAGTVTGCVQILCKFKK